jgi:hypothetical protein
MRKYELVKAFLEQQPMMGLFLTIALGVWQHPRAGAVEG